jgi:ammonia channel protein AmtB
MHLGFSFLEVGLTRQKNTINILFKNFFVITMGLIVYCAFGFNLLYPGNFVFDIASRKTRQGTGYLIALGFSFAFIFIIFFVMARAFAENGSIEPIIAVWLPNIIFSGLTYYMYNLIPK